MTMFRVPNDPANPTFDAVEKISFRRWFTSRKAERQEWARRRNTAARLAAENINRKMREDHEVVLRDRQRMLEEWKRAKEAKARKKTEEARKKTEEKQARPTRKPV